VSRFLDNTASEDRAAIRLHAHNAEVEYDDEYDDSYDDLGGGGADGIADVEGGTLLQHRCALQGPACECALVPSPCRSGWVRLLGGLLFGNLQTDSRFPLLLSTDIWLLRR
jgi:hypothetical protein